MIRALFISASLPPQWDSQTIRSLYLLSAADEFPIQFTFVSPAADVDQAHPCRELVPSGTASLTTAPIPMGGKVKAVERLFGKRAAWLYSNIYYRVAFPDSGRGWEALAYEAARDEIDSHGADVILSASGSVTAHLAAARLARETGLPWIADYGDPWSILDKQHRPVAALVSDQIEEQALSACSHLVFTAHATLDAYREWQGDYLPPATVIPYGYLAKDVQAMGASKCSEPLTISHIGVAFRGNRDLTPLIDALAGFNDLFRLEVVGSHSKSFESAARALTRPIFQGKVPYCEANVAMGRSDVLVVVGNKGALQIPGKTFIALGSRKVVLYIGQRPREVDPAYRALGALPGVVSCSNNVPSIERALGELSNNWSRLVEDAGRRPSLDTVQNLESTNLSRKYLRLVEEHANRRMS